jgi:hypothetical protein
VKPKQELGFSPNTLELIFPIEDYIGSTYDVKVEYCDYLGNVSKTVSEVKNFTFTPTPFRANEIVSKKSVVDDLRTGAITIPITAPAVNNTGSMYFSGSLLYIYTGTSWKSASLS